MVLIKPLLTEAISLYFLMFVFLAMEFTLKTFLGEVNVSIIFGLFKTINKILKLFLGKDRIDSM